MSTGARRPGLGLPRLLPVRLPRLLRLPHLDGARIGRLFRKELRQIFRDPRMSRIIFIAPIIQLVIFGYAVNTDIRETPMYVVDHDGSRDSRGLVDALTASGYFRVVGRSGRPAGLERALDEGSAIVGLQIPPDYAEDLRAERGASVQLLVDGTLSLIHI